MRFALASSGLALALGLAACGDNTPGATSDAAPDATSTPDAAVDAGIDALRIAGVTVSAASGPTSEAGQTATFTVALSIAPTADVVLAMISTTPGEGTVTASLTFTPANWDQAQTVTVTGVDDDVDDGDQAYAVTVTGATSDDPIWSSLAAVSVDLVNLDDDASTVTIVDNSGMTSEGGGQATINVQLASQPAADVTIDFASDDITEGTHTSTAVFTPANWNVAQTLTVTGVDDAVADGPITYGLTATFSSTDPLYAAAVAPTIALVNADDDNAGITVGAISRHTTEASGEATFDVVLSSEPTANVSLTFASNDLTEGFLPTDVITFTPANWQTIQSVTVRGSDDDVDDGDIAYALNLMTVASSDATYGALTADPVAVINDDDDTAAINATLVAGNHTSEAGAQVEVSVVLASQPTDDVVIDVASSDLTEGTVAPATLTFTAANWDTAQTVTMTGVDDFDIDGDIAYQMTFGSVTSNDAIYAALAPAPIDLINDDAGELCSAFGGDDFEDGDVVGWTGTGNFSAGASGADGTNFFGRLTSSGTFYNGATQSFTGMQPSKLSLWLRADASNAARNYVVLGDANIATNNGILFLYATGGGSWRVFNTAGNNFLPVVADQWEFFEIDFDWTARTFDVTVNGSLLVDNFAFRSTTSTDVTRLDFFNLDGAPIASYDEIELACE